MSYSSRYGGGGDSRRHSSSRRDSPPRHRSRRSPSPGPSRGRSSPRRDPSRLPETFGRVQDSSRPVDDDLNILQRMKTAYENSPLQDLYSCVKEGTKVKIWTRNYKEVRGVMTGNIVAFDKHWNLILRDVDEVYLKPKKSKTPFLRDIAPNENLPDIPAKVPKEKKTDSTEPEAGSEAAPVEKEQKEEDDAEKKKKKRRKKAKSTSEKRNMDMIFIRGDNIVMVCPLDESAAAEEEEEEEEEVDGTRKSG